MLNLDHPDLPFAIKDQTLIRRNGTKEPAPPDLTLLYLCYLKLAEIAENTKPAKLEFTSGFMQDAVASEVKPSTKKGN